MGQDNHQKPQRRRRWPWLLGGMAAFVAAVVALAPLAAEWAAEDWLKMNGAPDAEIDNIDFNPFTGRFALYNLRAGGGDKERFHVGVLAADIDYLPLFSKRVALRTIALRDTAVDVDVANAEAIRIGALRIPLAGEQGHAPSEAPAEEASAPWHFGIEGIELANVEVTVTHPLRREDVRINRLRVTQLQSWMPDRPVPIELDVVANGAALALTADTLPFAEAPSAQGALWIEGLDLDAYSGILADAGIENARGKISLDYQLGARLDRDGMEIEAEGRLSAEALHLEMPDTVFDQRLLTWQLRTDVAVEQATVVVENHGEIASEGVAIETRDVSVTQHALSWRGQSTATLPPPAGEPMVSVQGELQLSDTAAALPGLAMRIAQDRLAWTGDIQYGAAGGDANVPLAMNAQLALDGVQVHDTRADLMLASLASLAVERLQLNGVSDVRAGRVTLSTLRALADGTATEAGIEQMLAVDDITLSNAVYRDSEAVEVGDIVVSGLQLAMLGDEQGNFKWLSPLLATDADAPPAEPMDGADVESDAQIAAAVDDAPGEPLAIKVGLAKLAGDSWIVFEDQAVAPVFRTRIQPLGLTVTGIDSRRPDTPAQLALNANIGQYTEFNIAGPVHLFHDPISAELEGRLAGLDLPPLSSYSAHYIGYDLKRGRLDVDIDVDIDRGQIDSTNMVYLSKLNIVQKDEETAKKFSDQLAMPLDAALGMLRDKKGNIKFALPVQGDITQPEFKLSGVINLALAKALKTAAMRYVTNALQPLGAVLFVGKVAGKAMQMKFEPVIFDAGQAQINANAAAYLDKIGTLLEERPALSVTVCGIANLDDQAVVTQQLVPPAPADQASATTPPPTDEPANAARTAPVPAVDPEHLREALLDLAAQRGSRVKDYLVNDKGIAQERLFSCRPLVDDRDDAAPSVEITL